MGKYQLDMKSKVAAAKYQDGKKPAVSNKKIKSISFEKRI